MDLRRGCQRLIAGLAAVHGVDTSTVVSLQRAASTFVRQCTPEIRQSVRTWWMTSPFGRSSMAGTASSSIPSIPSIPAMSTLITRVVGRAVPTNSHVSRRSFQDPYVFIASQSCASGTSSGLGSPTAAWSAITVARPLPTSVPFHSPASSVTRVFQSRGLISQSNSTTIQGTMKTPLLAAVPPRRLLNTASLDAARLNQLRTQADAFPEDPRRQYEYIRLLGRLQPDAVVARVDSQRFAMDSRVLREYVRAANTLGLTDKAARARQVLNEIGETSGSNSDAFAPAGFGASTEFSAANSVGGAAASGGASSGAGSHVLRGTSPSNPVHVVLAESTKNSWLRTVRAIAVLFIVISAFGAMMEEKGPGRGFGLVNEMKPVLHPDKRFTDVKGCDEAKAELEEVVEFLRHPDRFTRLGGKLPKGVLLVGPPGTGKTLLAKAIAGEAGVPFFYCSGSEFDEMFVGVGARRIRELFAAAKKHAPCIIFLDEIDAVGATRNPKDQQYMRMTLNQLLAEMDGFQANDGVIVIGATNFPESLDKALLRPGRFDRHVTVAPPDVEGRRQILELYTGSLPLGSDVDLRVVARGTPGFCGADLSNLVNIAAVKASMDGLSQISMSALEFAKDRIMMGAERKSHMMSPKDREIVAFHEGGHAVVAHFTEGARPIHKATILPRGQALGMVMQLPETDEENLTKRQLIAMIDVCMGGRVAEEMIFGKDSITTGASSDIRQATRIAREMVMRYGMSEKVGPVMHEGSHDNVRTGALGGSSRNEIVEDEVQRLLLESYSRVRELLKQKEKLLRTLATTLQEYETLSGHDIAELFKTGSLKRKAA